MNGIGAILKGTSESNLTSSTVGGRSKKMVHSHQQCKRVPSSHPSLTLMTRKSEKNESSSVMSESLRSHGLYSPWNSPGQNSGVGSVPFSRESSQHRDQTQVSCIAGGFFTS